MKPTSMKEKIANLLALSQSPNENEAKAALLKARELMAKHKLAEAELGGTEKRAVRDIRTSVTFSRRRDPWIGALSSVIGENYCCKVYRAHAQGKQTQTVGFIGLEEDAGICTAIFSYAVDCVHSGIKRMKKERRREHPGHVKALCDSYGYGFAKGVMDAFSGQQEEHKDEWGLALTIPKEVMDASGHLGHDDFKARAQEGILPGGYARGYADGSRFDPSRRLAGAETT